MSEVCAATWEGGRSGRGMKPWGLTLFSLAEVVLGQEEALLHCTPSLEQAECALNGIDRALQPVPQLWSNFWLSNTGQLARQRELTKLKVSKGSLELFEVRF